MILKSGITTGACAAAAAGAAASVLAGLPPPSHVDLDLPEGGTLRVLIRSCSASGAVASASVIKEAGDDPDITNGTVIEVQLRVLEEGDLIFRAGPGVGTVTMPGLAIKQGEPAINPVPRRMITEAVRKHFGGPLEITVSIPDGVALAGKTFNPRLGIEGGLSVLGTTGIVRPFSKESIQETIRCAVNVAFETGIRFPVIVPGNIGRRAANGMFELEKYQVLEIGNEWGFAIELAEKRGFDGVLIVGHPGKLAKLAAGNWDTHSARSGSALKALETVLPDKYKETILQVKTAEAFFQGMDSEQSKEAGRLVAGSIKSAVEQKLGNLNVGVVLIDLKGEMLGTAGDLQFWKERVCV